MLRKRLRESIERTAVFENMKENTKQNKSKRRQKTETETEKEQEQEQEQELELEQRRIKSTRPCLMKSPC